MPLEISREKKEWYSTGRRWDSAARDFKKEKWMMLDRKKEMVLNGKKEFQERKWSFMGRTILECKKVHDSFLQKEKSALCR